MFERASTAFGSRRRLVDAWQDRFRDPSLTALLVLELCAIFLAAPLAANGLAIASAVADTLVLAVLLIVVMLSHKWGAILAILLGLSATAASYLLRGGGILAFSALIWVVAHAVYAPGRITFHRLQGAVVIYLSFATIFASVFSLIWELSPEAFANLGVQASGPQGVATM